jgi:hypothetical protein
MPPETTQGNRELRESAELIAVALHQISHDLHRLTDIATQHAPLLDAYRSGGLLAMRAARKAANGKRD